MIDACELRDCRDIVLLGRPAYKPYEVKHVEVPTRVSLCPLANVYPLQKVAPLRASSLICSRNLAFANEHGVRTLESSFVLTLPQTISDEDLQGEKFWKGTLAR